MFGQDSSTLTYIIYFAVLIGLMYFIMIAPQRKRQKKEAQMLGSLKEGDNIVTIGGIIGKVINIKDDEITIESSVEKTQLRVTKRAIADIKSPEEGK